MGEANGAGGLKSRLRHHAFQPAQTPMFEGFRRHFREHSQQKIVSRAFSLLTESLCLLRGLFTGRGAASR
jgi:hypothetical protein